MPNDARLDPPAATDAPDDWAAIVTAHAGLVWSTIGRLIDTHEDREDVFQETFASAVRLSSRQPIGSWPATLVHLATRRAIDKLRSRTRGHPPPSGDVSELATQPFGPVDEAIARELGGTLRTAISALPGRQAEVFALASLSDWSHGRIAELLGVSVDSVSKTISRVRSMLRRQLQHTGAISSPAVSTSSKGGDA